MSENKKFELPKSFGTHSLVSGSLCSLLTIFFIVLKLDPGGHLTSRVTEWSWWWVLSPLWLPSAACIGLVAVIFVIAIAIAVIGCIFAGIAELVKLAK